ncbi:MAG: nucleotidyltransferase domain-containing protein [Deltaproteobacteria bacterium]|nr:nucleotidyltransferase domain-containing protein [Deltaproteobacteria bacterium]
MIEAPIVRTALSQLKTKLTANYPVARLVLFGSIVRGETDEESDVDVLVLTSRPLKSMERNAIYDEVFSINLHYGTNLSVLVTDVDNWEDGPLSVMPIRKEVEKEGEPL